MAGLASLSIQAAAGLAQAALRNDKANPAILAELAELCRAAGELDLAMTLAERAVRQAPELSAAPGRQGLKFLLAGAKDWALYPAREGAPVPYIRVTDFLAPEIHTQIIELASASLAQFTPAQVAAYGHEDVNAQIRSSFILERNAFVPLFIPLLKAFIKSEAFAPALPPGMAPRLLELQVTAHPDGGFFDRHSDVTPPHDMTRKVSFVYYFHFEPKPFTGGALVLFDGATGANRTTGCTRIWPVQNSIIFFPSERLHEVEKVHSTTSGLPGSRFSLNGWLGWKPSAK